jgi:23S rRNA (cytidine1920-2'-O)/16S rRNA (cytidine1409-2'-O)-methyltransferase
VVRDPAVRTGAVLAVAEVAAGLGLGVAGVVASPLPGPSGNVEFFLWLRRGAPPVDPDEVARVVAAGPTGPTGPAGPAGGAGHDGGTEG